MRKTIFSIFILFIFLLEFAVAKSTFVGPLEKPGDGCGCRFEKQGSKDTYAWSELGEFGTSESIQIRIDGKDLVLSKKSSDFPDSKRNPNKAEPKKGDRLKEVFEGHGVTAMFNYLYKGGCADLQGKVGESCEYKSYEIEMHVSRKSEKKSIKLYGNCGC